MARAPRKTLVDPALPFHERVWAVVARIPRGKVASYADVGLYAGFPRAARHVARVMKIAKGAEFPWHRVVGANGEVRITNPPLRAEQIRRLKKEGVPVDERGRFPYATFAWKP